MMVYKSRDYWVFGFCSTSGILKNMTFRKLHLFASAMSLWGTSTSWGPDDGTN
jgi:hypothetical protein